MSGDFHPNSQSTITSGDFHLGTTWWPPLLSRWKSPGVSFPGVWVIFAENLKVINANKCSHRWQANLVLFCFGGGQVPQRCLVSKFISSIKCFDLAQQVHTQGAGLFQLQILPSGGEGVIHSPACFLMRTTSRAGAIRAKLIWGFRACTRAIYSRAGFGERLLAWLTSEPACTNSFCPNWSRLP